MPDIQDYLEIRTASPANFSPDGETLLVLSDLTGTQQLYRVPRVGGALEPVTRFPEPVGGAYLPTSRRVVMTMDDGGNERHQIYLVDEDGENFERRVYDPEVMHQPGGVSRDGTQLAYSCNRRNGIEFDVYVHSLDRPLSEGSPDRCVFDMGGFCRAVGFSPDGRWLAVLRPTDKSLDTELWLVDLASPESPAPTFQIAPRDGDAAMGPPRWLPDGSSFYFATDVDSDLGGIARYDIDRADWEYVLELGHEAGCWMDWQARNLLVVTNADGYSGAELRDPHTFEVRRRIELPHGGVAADWTFSRDGR